MKFIFFILLTTNAFAQTAQVAPEYSISINGDVHYSINQPVGGNIVLTTVNSQTSQTPVLKVPKNTIFENLTISQPLTNTESIANYFNSVIKGTFSSSATPFNLLIAKSASGNLTFTEFENLKIKSITLPELNASTREILHLVYNLSVGQQVKAQPKLPIKKINRPSAISSNFSFKINLQDITTYKISPIKINITGEDSTSSEVLNFTATVAASEISFLQELQNGQIKTAGTSSELALAQIVYLNPALTTPLYTVNISKLGIAAIRALPTTNAIQKYEVEFFASKVELIKN